MYMESSDRFKNQFPDFEGTRSNHFWKMSVCVNVDVCKQNFVLAISSKLSYGQGSNFAPKYFWAWSGID